MYAQIYILNIVEQLNVRRANNNNLDPVIIDNLQTILVKTPDLAVIKPWSSGLLGLTSTNQVVSFPVLAHKEKRRFITEGGDEQEGGLIDNKAKE